MEQSNKKIITLAALAVILLLALGFYLLLRGRVAPPAVAPPVAIPPMERLMTAEDKMNVLRRLSTKTVSVAERKNILRMMK